MFIKGTAVLARREQICRMFGEERWNAFMESVARRDPAFGDKIYVTSRISLESFLSFQQDLVDTFFSDLKDPYFEMGIQASRWAFSDGPHARVLDDTQLPLDRFLEMVPVEIWHKYYDFGSMVVRMDGGVMTARLDGIPIEHPYFERTIAGFMLETVKILGGQGPKVRHWRGEEPGVLNFEVTVERMRPRL